MRPRLLLVLFLLACWCAAASAQEPIPHDQWVNLVCGSEKTPLHLFAR